MENTKLRNSIISKFDFFSRRDGFTLLEIMIVLFLITLILGLSAVFFANVLPSHKLNASVRELSATIRRAHMLAEVSGSRQTVSIDLDARKYGIEGRGYKSFDPDITVRVLDPFDGESRTGIHNMIFQASGGIQGETIIMGAGKKKVKIELDPVVGTVVVK
jgi:prepilin-type N-terminal cleavage/methylation domain-containing protein